MKQKLNPHRVLCPSPYWSLSGDPASVHFPTEVCTFLRFVPLYTLLNPPSVSPHDTTHLAYQVYSVYYTHWAFHPIHCTASLHHSECLCFMSSKPILIDPKESYCGCRNLKINPINMLSHSHFVFKDGLALSECLVTNSQFSFPIAKQFLGIFIAINIFSKLI